MSDDAGLSLKPGFETALDTPSPEASALKRACDKACDDQPASCSHAVNQVIRQMHGLSEADWPQRQANTMVVFLAANWVEVKLERAYELAQRGIVVVGGKAETSKNGHAIVVYPGAKRPRGGYDYMYQGAMTRMRESGAFPRAMSTSSGTWPGARSCGDKTVWDPWGNDATFLAVKFWARQIDAAAKANVSVNITARRRA